MCGILGTLGAPVDEAAFREGLRRLRHRGPDDEGVERHDVPGGKLRLGFRRLAVQDPAPRGNQPMADPGGRLRIVFNGEIYNVRSLRRTLEGRGHRFRTSTDTEVLLAGWMEWGPEVLPRLVGMFAFAVADLDSGELFLARDHLGIKPLYLHEGPGGLAFASEVKALLPLLSGPPSLDPEQAARFFTFLWVPEPETLFQNVRALPAGGWLRVGPEGREEGRWWELPMGPDEPLSFPEAVDELEELLLKSVDLQLISDVPLGAFLSGGVDSSLIVALMRRAGARPVRTHTALFPEEDRGWRIEEDDAPWARRVVELFPDLEAHEHLLTPEVAELLPLLAWHMDDPVADPAALVTYLICRAARPTTTVLLSGMGAEELFAGYPRHRAALLARRYRSLPGPLRRGLLEPAVARLPGARPGPFLGPIRGAKKFIRGAGLPFEEGYLTFAAYYTPEELRRLVPGADSGDPWARHRALLARSRGRDPVRRMTHLDLLTFLPSLNLAYTDRAAMAASVEVRVPILDHRIVELARRLPSDHLLRGRRTKRVLKAAAERHLPKPVVHRRKAGFQAPVRGWVQGPLDPMIRDLLAPDRLRRRGILDPVEVDRILEESRSGREDHALRIWAFLSFELWAATFLDGDGSAPVVP